MLPYVPTLTCVDAATRSVGTSATHEYSPVIVGVTQSMTSLERVEPMLRTMRLRDSLM